MKIAKEKTGVPRLFELAGTKKYKLGIACLLSVLSSAARMIPFFYNLWNLATDHFLSGHTFRI